jgi:hypothetical protein
MHVISGKNYYIVKLSWMFKKLKIFVISSYLTSIHCNAVPHQLTNNCSVKSSGMWHGVVWQTNYSTLKKEAAVSSKMLVPIYETVQRQSQKTVSSHSLPWEDQISQMEHWPQYRYKKDTPDVPASENDVRILLNLCESCVQRKSHKGCININRT